MPVFLSNDQLDRVVETFEKQQLTDTPANTTFTESVRWLASRMFKTRAYRIVFALCRELARLDYRLAHRGLNPGERRYSGAYGSRYVLTHEPTLHDVEDLLSHLAQAPQLLKTASALAQAAFAYYREHGQPLVVPRNIQPSPTERADVQRVIE